MRRRLALLATLLATPAGASTWIVPGVASTAGAGGTRFTSELVLANPTPRAATALVELIPAPGEDAGEALPLFLAPGETVRVPDVARRLSGRDGTAGALRITAAQPLVAGGRTVNVAGSGAFGVGLPVFAEGTYLAPGQRASAIWVTHRDPAAGGSRANVAVTFPGATGGAARLTLYTSGPGVETRAGELVLSANSPAFVQRSVGELSAGGDVTDVEVGRIELEPLSGTAIGYVVDVDNVTGDGSLFPFRTVAAGATDIVLPGAARTAGAGGSYWRTDVRLYNPAPEDVPVTLTYLPGTGGDPVTVSRALGPRRVETVTDVLGALGLPDGSYGALRVEAPGPVVVAGRTANVDPRGERAGTFGGAQEAIPRAAFARAGDALALAGLSHGAASRTNVTFVAGADGASWRATLLARDGREAGTASGTLVSSGWSQTTLLQLVPSAPDDARLHVEVTAGSLTAFASVIDQSSGDPVVTAAVPEVPIPEAALPPLAACPAGPLFDTLPMAATDFLSFRPLGWTSPTTHILPCKHSCFSLTRPGEPYRVSPVYFPGKVWVTRVNLVEFLDAAGNVAKSSYVLWFQPCKDATAYFTHLSWVPSKLSALVRRDRCRSFVTGGTPAKLCENDTLVAVDAGELAGLSGDAMIVDFGMTDYRRPPLPFARPDHYMREYLAYVSPVEYFTEAPRRILDASLASYDGTVPRTAEPRIGQVCQDLAGTAQGSWFVPGANLAVPYQIQDPLVALVHDYVDPAEPIFSVGTGVAGLDPGVYRFFPEPTGTRNADFSRIRADGTTYCFDRFGPSGVEQRTAGGIPARVPRGVLLLTMPSPETMRLELIGTSGASCASIGPYAFSAGASRFER